MKEKKSSINIQEYKQITEIENIVSEGISPKSVYPLFVHNQLSAPASKIIRSFFFFFFFSYCIKQKININL